MENVTIRKVNIGDLFFQSPDDVFVAKEINFNTLSLAKLYKIAYNNFKYIPGYVLDLKVIDIHKFKHLDVIEYWYRVPEEWGSKYDMLSPIKNTLLPVMLNKKSSTYYK